MKTYKVIGLMSGTSLDGLDIAYCYIYKNLGKWKFKIKETYSISYTTEMMEQLKNSIHLSAEDLLELNVFYGIWLGRNLKEFISTNALTVDFIASHGHTTHHRPEKGFTFQIGSGQHLANESRHQVICDFRSNDIALGGQGAPLVPIGDCLFFSDYTFCLNLGGISNISFEQNGVRIAYDIGLANMLLNHITAKINIAYDKGGKLAAKGHINAWLLNALNSLEYYQTPFPKSTGYEWFIEEVVPIIDHTEDSIENLLHTSIHHICEQVAKEITTNSTLKNNTLLVTGGGAFNSFMMELLQEKLNTKAHIHIPSKLLVEFKEALVFGLMGVLRMENKINVLSSVTGAKKDSSSGTLFYPS